MEDTSFVGIGRRPSIENEPRTLRMDQIQFAREAARYVVNTKNIEEAMSIFTEGLEPLAVVSSMKQNGDEMMDSVEELKYVEDYIRSRSRARARPRLRDVLTAPF